MSDRTKSGYLSGVQARNILIQSRLPQQALAQIWSVSYFIFYFKLDKVEIKTIYIVSRGEGIGDPGTSLSEGVFCDILFGIFSRVRCHGTNM